MTIARRIKALRQKIRQTCELTQRHLHEISLVAVSKKQPISAIMAAYQEGVRDFGENYWQEAQHKIAQLTDYEIIWHFIGPLQSNKAAEIARHFNWVHSVDREKIIPLLAQHRALTMPPLNICIQVNLDNESNKSGVKPQHTIELATQLERFPNLKLRGLMAIPAPQITPGDQLTSLQRLTTLWEDCNQHLSVKMDTLSMGMSNDLVAAIQAGSTSLRIGEAIFGKREG